MNPLLPLRATCILCQSGHYQTLYPSTFDAKKHLTAKLFSARRMPDRIHGTIVKCDSCGLVRTLEIIPQQTLARLYRKSTFSYTQLTQNLSRTYALALTKALPYLKSRVSFLEIGCGNGFFLRQAQKLGFKKVFGIEPSQDAVSRAVPAVKKLIINDIFTSDLFPAGSFNLIAAFQVFDHIDDPLQFLNLCHRYLSSEGLLLLFNHNVDSYSAKILGRASPIFDIEHPFLYSPTTLQKMLSRNKFQSLVCYSPPSFISLRHLLQLIPLPPIIKRTLFGSPASILDLTLKVRLGNVTAVARKQT